MITLILGVFHHFCKSAISASRQRENFMESLHSDSSATYLLIIWAEKIIPLAMKSKQKPYPSIVFLSIFEILQISSLISTDQKKNIICTMDDVRGDFLGPPHGTTPAAVIANKI